MEVNEPQTKLISSLVFNLFWSTTTQWHRIGIVFSHWLTASHFSQVTRRQDYDDYYEDDYDETPETRGYGHSTSSGYSDHGSSYDGGHDKGHGGYGGYKVQPKKPGPYGYPSPNFKCEKTSETLYVTETEMTYDKKCFNVYKTKCQDGYDEGKVNRRVIKSNMIIDYFQLRASGIRSIATSSRWPGVGLCSTQAPRSGAGLCTRSSATWPTRPWWTTSTSRSAPTATRRSATDTDITRSARR